MRNYFPKRSSDAPLHTFSKLYDVPIDFFNPTPSFEAVYCFICCRRRVTVFRYQIICLLFLQISSSMIISIHRKLRINASRSVSEYHTAEKSTHPKSDIRPSTDNIYNEIQIYELADNTHQQTTLQKATTTNSRTSASPYEDTSASTGQYDHLGEQRPKKQLGFFESARHYGAVRLSQRMSVHLSGLYNTLMRRNPAIAGLNYTDHQWRNVDSSLWNRIQPVVLYPSTNIQGYIVFFPICLSVCSELYHSLQPPTCILH